MGIVYEAEQDNPRRTVAIKVIRPGYASPELLSRFRHEAGILARLQHPGIAQVYEAGIDDDGRPFFAMEFIRGMPLDEYAQSRSQTSRAPRAAGEGVRRGSARSRQGRHSSRLEARQHPGRSIRPAEGARLRCRPRDRRRPADHRGSNPGRSTAGHAELHESGTGRSRPGRARRTVGRVHTRRHSL